MTFRQEARDALVERFRDGDKVNGLRLRDLVDCDLSGPRAYFAAIEVAGILVADVDDFNLRRNFYFDRLIAEYLNTHPDLITDLAADMVREYAESQQRRTA